MKSKFRLVVFAIITAIAYNTLGMKDDHNDLSNKTATTEVDAYWSSEEKDAKLDKIWEYYNYWYKQLPKDASCFGWVAPEFVNHMAYDCFIGVLHRDFETRGSETVIHDYCERANCFTDTEFMQYLVTNRVFMKILCDGGNILCPSGLWKRDDFKKFYQDYMS